MGKELFYKNEISLKKENHENYEKFSGEYMNFLDYAKTERRSVKFFKDLLSGNGFVDLEKAERENIQTDKYYITRDDKVLVAFNLTDNIEDGFNMIAAHVDSPRLDFKPNPIEEKEEIALIKTHYYGGIKKYQWLNIPLAIVGTVIMNDGSKKEIECGLDDNDPVFVVSDLLPHLDSRKGEVSKVFLGKNLQAIASSIPICNEDDQNDKEDLVKANLLKIVNEKYGLKEEDFIKSEFQMVPTFKSKFVGFDKGLIGAYGHDDRVCSYTAIKALTDSKKFKKSASVLLFDKEEIGSEGISGAKSEFWSHAFERVLYLKGIKDPVFKTHLIFDKSDMLSGDVCAAVNPLYSDVHDPTNSPKVHYGIGICKYTGARGKSGTNDASAELIGKIVNLFNKYSVGWQITILGEVDQGGGGTVAKFFSEKGVNVIDAGTPTIGMHSPYELISKIDLYETYNAYKCFLENNE